MLRPLEEHDGEKRKNKLVREPKKRKARGKLYCVCKRPWDKVSAMVECDKKSDSACLEWCHLQCLERMNIHVTLPDKKKDTVAFTCINCANKDVGANGASSAKKRRTQ